MLINIPIPDLQHLEGLTFRIIKIDYIPNLELFLGIVSGEKEEDKDKLVYRKN